MTQDRSATGIKTRLIISIRTKLTFAFLAVLVIPVFSMLWLLSRQLETAFNRLDQPRLRNARAAVEADFENRMSNVRLQGHALAQDAGLAESAHLVVASGYTRYLGNLVDEVNRLGQSSKADFIRLAAPDRILARYPERYNFDTTLPAQDVAYVKAAFQGRTGMAMSETVRDKKRVLILKTFYPLRYRAAQEDRGWIPIDGALIVGSVLVNDKYLERLHDISSAQILFYNGDSFRGAFPEIRPSSQPVDKIFLQTLARVRTHKKIGRLGGREYVFGGVTIREPETREPVGCFVLGVSRAQLNAVKEKTRGDVLYIAGLGAGLALLLGALLSIGISRPIRSLARSARLIGSGQFMDAPNTVRSRDEVGLLADAMNLMIDDIRAYHEKLIKSERVAAWREIARRIAHEIKNPLSPIQLSIENMKALYTQDPDEFHRIFPEATDTVLEEVDKLRRLANEFSEFARMPRPNFEKTDIGEVVENVVHLHAAAAPHVSASFTADRNGNLLVQADRDQLNRAFTNLVKNATEAMPDGGRLDVAVRAVNDEILVIIEDTGLGMDTEKLARIFTPYYTTKKQGSGLGLAMVQRILHDHGASLDVYSEPGRGTKFIVAFKQLDESPAAGGPSDG